MKEGFISWLQNNEIRIWVEKKAIYMEIPYGFRLCNRKKKSAVAFFLLFSTNKNLFQKIKRLFLCNILFLPVQTDTSCAGRGKHPSSCISGRAYPAACSPADYMFRREASDQAYILNRRIANESLFITAVFLLE